jgi:hypothetical protein
MSTLDQYRQMHAAGHFSGHSTKKWMPVVSRLCAEFAPTTLLDYGCGKGDQWKTLTTEWMLPMPTLYDPAVPGLDVLPNERFDGVLCLDVLEHLEGEELNVCISNCLSRANKFVFFGISTRLAKKCLPDGRNCHITVQPLEWWKEKVGAFAKNVNRPTPLTIEIHDEAYIE